MLYQENDSSNPLVADSLCRIYLISAISGTLSGAVAALFTAPLDLAKTRQISMKSQTTIFSTVRGIVSNNGFLGLYRGLSVTLMGLIPTWGIYWSTYTSLKYIQTNYGKRDGTSFTVHLASALGAGVATITLTNPFWVVKTRLQMQDVSTHSKELTIHDTFSTILSEGRGGLTRGLFPSLLGVTHVCIQFPLYERAKLTFKKWKNKNNNNELNFVEIMLSSVVSKIVASVAAYPHEVLRIRQQMEQGVRSSLWGLAKKMLAEEGLLGFYRGLATNLVRVAPASSITFVSFEYISRFLERVT